MKIYHQTTFLDFIVNNDSNGKAVSVSANNYQIKTISSLILQSDKADTIEDNVHTALFFKISF